MDECLGYKVLECEKIDNSVKLSFIEKVAFNIETVKEIDNSLMEKMIELKKYARNIRTIFELTFILIDENFSNYFKTPEFDKIDFEELDEITGDSRYNEFLKKIVYSKMFFFYARDAWFNGK